MRWLMWRAISARHLEQDPFEVPKQPKISAKRLAAIGFVSKDDTGGKKKPAAKKPAAKKPATKKPKKA